MDTASPADEPPVRVWRRLVLGRSLKVTLTRATILAVTCFVLFKFVFIPVRVDGVSMAPTYGNGVNLVNRLAYRGGAGPARGDVVAVRFRPNGRSVLLMKRVVGLPGEWIGFRGGQVTVNGRQLDEPYVRFPSDWDVEPKLCGEDEFFVVGDNRSMPPDNHQHGRARRVLIAGKMLW